MMVIQQEKPKGRRIDAVTGDGRKTQRTVGWKRFALDRKIWGYKDRGG